MFCLPVPIHSYICDIFIYFKDRSAYSPAGKCVDQSWEYINCSQTQECGNWDSGRTIPGNKYINGIFLAVHRYTHCRLNISSSCERSATKFSLYFCYVSEILLAFYTWNFPLQTINGFAPSCYSAGQGRPVETVNALLYSR
jgi:hypothetical protein